VYTRVFFLDYHMDAEVLESGINELIACCREKGDIVEDIDVEIAPRKLPEGVHQYFGHRYLIVLKCRDRDDGEAGS
jgi:hypothetical protein